jgi:hypothetical protein
MMPTVLDVLENALGERGDRVDWAKLSRSQIDNLRERLLEFSAADAHTNAPDGTYMMNGSFARYWEDPLFRGDLANALLYYPQLLALDPFADFFADTSALPPMRDLRYMKNGREIMRLSGGGAIWSQGDSAERLGNDTAAVANRLSEIAANLYQLEAPIRSNVVLLRNQWAVIKGARAALEASVRHDVRDASMQDTVRRLNDRNGQLSLWDNLRGFHITGSGDLHSPDAPWEFQHYFFHLAKTLAVADSAGAVYAPTQTADLELLAAKIRATPPAGYPPQVLAEVGRVVVPTVDVAIAEAVSIRAGSEEFDLWRAKLRSLQKASASDSSAELRERIQDELQPEIARVRRELSGRGRRVAKDALTEMLLFGTISTAATAATSENVVTGTLVGVAAATATGVVSWIRNAYRRPVLHGTDLILASLVRFSH